MKTLQDLKNTLNSYGIENFNLTREFSHTTKNGDYVYKLNLFNIDNNKRLSQVNYLLKGVNSIKITKTGKCFGYSQIYDYIAHEIPELKQTRL